MNRAWANNDQEPLVAPMENVRDRCPGFGDLFDHLSGYRITCDQLVWRGKALDLFDPYIVDGAEGGMAHGYHSLI